MQGLGIDLNGGVFISFEAEEIALAFKERVEADFGVFEALNCLISEIESL